MKKIIRKILFITVLSSVTLACNNRPGNSTEPEDSPNNWLEKSLPTIPDKDEVEYETSPELIQDQITAGPASADIENFYAEREYGPAWKKEENRNTFLKLLEKAEDEGLFPEDYNQKKILEILSFEDPKAEAIAELDILLTDAFFKYAHDLYYGKLDPKKLYEHWGVSRKPVDLSGLLAKGLEEENLQATFDRLRPAHPIYSDLKAALAEYKQLKEKEQPFKKVEKGELIRPGDKDFRISSIAQRLKELKIIADSVEVTDSLYTGTLQEGIKKFQHQKGLKVDGIIGNSTISELNMTPSERYKQILANLERWRWYPRDLGEHYILINIPEFRLAVVKDGDTVRRHNVIAGSRARQTAVFTDTLEYIVINPQWNVPPTIKKEDVIPKASRDPNYLASHNMKVIGRDGRTVDPSTIDWSGSQPYSYNFVQRAGPSNPLGQVKIIYPNKYLIYLHDTPAQSLFSRNQRAESSGCVRVENAVNLSAYILENQPEWSEERIRETIATGATKQVKINRPIQVHHFYWTAWRAGDKTVFTEDVYNLDKEIYSRLLQSN